MFSTPGQTISDRYRHRAPMTVSGGGASDVATGWRRAIYLVLAAGCFGCGMVGVVLPGLPTTPFLLLTSYFLLRSSRRLHDRLLASRLFGDLLRNWQQHRGIRRSTRTKAIALTVGVVAVSAGFSTFSPVLLIAMLGGASIGLAVIVSLPVLEG